MPYFASSTGLTKEESQTMSDADLPEYETYYNEKFASTLEDADGALDKDAVMRELYDYGQTLDKFARYVHFSTGGKTQDPEDPLEHLQALAIETATFTAKAAIVQALNELQAELQANNENQRNEPALEQIALYLLSLAATMEPAQ